MLVMSVELLTDRYSEQIAGILSCYDRILIFGTLPHICFAEGMTSWLYKSQVRIFDYPRFAEPFRDQLREECRKNWLPTMESRLSLFAKEFPKGGAIKEVLAKTRRSTRLGMDFLGYGAVLDLQTVA